VNFSIHVFWLKKFPLENFPEKQAPVRFLKGVPFLYKHLPGAKDEKIIIDTVMREICNLYTNAKRDEFSIDEIIQYSLGAYSKEYVFQFISKFENQTSYIELLAQDRVRLTDAGKKYCKSV
jgi:hypothetical protein